MINLSIVDPHMHLWDLNLNPYPWLTKPSSIDHHGNLTSIARNHLVENYLINNPSYPISKSVHIQAGWDSTDPSGESAWLQNLAESQQHPHGFIAYIDLSLSNSQEILEKHLLYKNFRGIRQIVSYDPDKFYSGCSQNYLALPTWQKNFTLLNQYGLIFELQIYPEQADIAIKLIRKNPGVIFIISHLGKPKFRSAEYWVFWAAQMYKLAQLENVYMKICGFGMHEPNWMQASLSPFFNTVIDYFGVDRCMFASNAPIDTLYKSCTENYAIYFNLVKDFTQTEISKLINTNAANIYQLC